MNRHHHEAIERRETTRRDLLDALRRVLLAPRTKARTENRTPSKAELETRYRLDRERDE
ncbi:MAG: hypothetical protein OXQ90_09615 [Gammaproteobacteria bacterium]|nr:hypothetical protein [Gammaproteobacteria bacterium]